MTTTTPRSRARLIHPAEDDMTPAMQSRIPHRRPRRLVAVTGAILTIGLAACGDDTMSTSSPAPTVASTTTTALAGPTTVVDELITVDSGTMHVRCVGGGATTVLLIAGWGDAGDSWGAIEPTVAEHARVCSYARLGTGDSDAPSTTQTFATQASDLHALLDAAREPGPYVVLGHSFGGAEAVMFASQYPDEVVGLMLLDASPPTWPAAVCAVPDDGTDAARTFRAGCAVMHDPTQDAERLDVFPAFDEVDAVRSLDDLPLTVMTAARRTAPGLAADELARLDATWSDGVERWADLSTDSRVVSVEGTGHYIQVDQPDPVVAELLELVP